MKKWTIIFFCILSWTVSGFTLLLDPGHGGIDYGAKNTLTFNVSGKKVKVPVYEKDIALAITKKVHQKLKEHFQVYLTRDTDKAIGLDERASLADKYKADLFISIHINSEVSKSSTGFEIYYLDHHKDKAIGRIEKIENKNLKGNELTIDQILLDLVLDRTVPSSKKLAEQIGQRIKSNLGPYKMNDRGVRPGLFYVLALTKRPALLIEVGFMSQTNELKKMLHPEFQERFSSSIAQGILNFVKTENL